MSTVSTSGGGGGFGLLFLDLSVGGLLETFFVTIVSVGLSSPSSVIGGGGGGFRRRLIFILGRFIVEEVFPDAERSLRGGVIV